MVEFACDLLPHIDFPVQIVFVLTGFCNTTDEPGFEAYRQIATVSSGQLYIIGKGQVNEVGLIQAFRT